MLPDLVLLSTLLLHEGGWDEVLMVAVALGIAYFVIVWSGRKQDREDDEYDEEDEASDVEPPGAASDQPPTRH